MLIDLRDRNNKLVYKDILDVDFDMYVEEKQGIYYVRVNSAYRLDEGFETEEAAENRMRQLAYDRNFLEIELRSY